MSTSSDDSNDVHSFLRSRARDYLITGNGEQVKIKSLKGKKLGLYFSRRKCDLKDKLLKVYEELYPQGDFEIIFISWDHTKGRFKKFLRKFPWPALPYDDPVIERIEDLYVHHEGVPHLTIIDENGKILLCTAVNIIKEFGADAYPFSAKRMKELQDKVDRCRKEPCLKSVLASSSLDYVISSSGNKVPISALQKKMVALYFYEYTELCKNFTARIFEVYDILKAKNKSIELVLISLDDKEVAQEEFETKLWFTLPSQDEIGNKLIEFLGLKNWNGVLSFPKVVILGPDERPYNFNAAPSIQTYGHKAYPFTVEKIEEVEKIVKLGYELPEEDF